MIPKDAVRYRSGDSDSNAVLRLALLKEWGGRCYLCREPKDFVDTEIDHLLPHTLGSERLNEYKAEYLMAEQAAVFDVHAPHNLAPICRQCNGDKSNTSFVGVPALMTRLDKARKKEPAVEKFVKAARKRSDVTDALVALSTADLFDPIARDSLIELAPTLVNRLRTVIPEALEVPSNYDYGNVDPDEPHEFAYGPRILVTLDESSRRAKIVLEDFLGWDFDEALDVAVRQTQIAINQILIDDIVSQLSDEGHGDAHVENISGFTDLSVEEVRLVTDESGGVIWVRGSFEADGSAEAAVIDYQNDSGTEWIQRDASPVQGTFEVPLSADDSPSAEASDVDLKVD